MYGWCDDESSLPLPAKHGEGRNSINQLPFISQIHSTTKSSNPSVDRGGKHRTPVLWIFCLQSVLLIAVYHILVDLVEPGLCQGLVAQQRLIHVFVELIGPFLIRLLGLDVTKEALLECFQSRSQWLLHEADLAHGNLGLLGSNNLFSSALIPREARAAIALAVQPEVIVLPSVTVEYSRGHAACSF